MKRWSRKLLGIVLCAAMVIGLIPWGVLTEAKAVTATEKTIAGLGTSPIGNPPGNGQWHYVYYGKYNDNAVKYRVLSIKTTDFGGTTMLLDCDSTLFSTAEFDTEKSNIWANSSIKAGLNGELFLTKDGVFTQAESKAIASSTKAEKSARDGSGWWRTSENEGLNFAPLTGQKIFLLDAKEATSTTYGYKDNAQADGSREKNGADWWLRSPHSDPSGVGLVNRTGSLGVYSMNTTTPISFGVSPALNINLSSVIFTSLISGTAGNTGAQYKLTIKDSNISVTNANVMRDNTLIMLVPAVTGTYDRISVVMTDGSWSDTNGWSEGAAVKYYGQLDNDDYFTLPADYDSSWKTYLIAEDVNAGTATDYASTPVEITIPHEHHFTYTVSEREITATCTGDCPDGYNSLGIMLRLVLLELPIYDGNPKEVSVGGYPTPVPPGLEAKPSVDYYKSDGKGSNYPVGEKLSGAPTNCGNYVAQMTWGRQTVSLPFSITSNAISFDVTFKVENGAWDDGTTGDKVVTLSRQENEDKLLILQPGDIPPVGNSPDFGYKKEGSWTEGTVPVAQMPPDIAISKEHTYTFTYAAKPTAALTVTQADGVYGTALADPVYTKPDGAIGDPVITYTGTIWDGSAYGPSTEKPTQVGAYTVSVKVETANTVYSGSANFAVTPKSITGATVSLDKTQLTYNGSEQTVNVIGVTIDGLSLTSDDYEVTGNKGLDQGTYTVTVKGKGNVTDSATAEWSIVEKAMTVSVAGYNGAYDGTAHGIDVSVTDPASGAVVKYGATAGTYDLDASPKITDIGTLTVYFKVTADNYTDYTGSAVVTITAKPAAIVTTAPTAKTGLVASGNPQELVTAGEASGGTMQYALGSDGMTSPESGGGVALPVGTDAGTYFVWYKAVGDAAHVDSAATYVTATIAKAPEPPVPKDKEVSGEVGTKGKNKLALKWAAVDGAEGYDLFFTECGSELKHYKTVKPDVTEWTFKKLDVGTPYKMQVKAYVMQDGKKKYIGHTDTLHCITNGSDGHYTNAVKIKAKDQTIAEGEKKQLKVTLKGEEKGLPILPHGGAVRYESMNPDIATVDKDGNVKGVSTGSCKILLSTADGLRKTIVLTVKAGPEELRFGKKKYKVEVGKTLNLKKKLKISPSDAEVSLKWKSSDKSIAKVDKNGKVTGRKKGTVKITVTASNGVSVTVKVKVK